MFNSATSSSVYIYWIFNTVTIINVQLGKANGLADSTEGIDHRFPALFPSVYTVGCNENQNDPFLTKINSNSRVNNCELGILSNVKLPATTEYPTLSAKYYVYELIWNTPFELNDEWPFVRW